MADSKVFLPQQKTRRGVAGYRGDNIAVVGADGKEVKQASAAAAKAAKARKAETAKAASDADSGS